MFNNDKSIADDLAEQVRMPSLDSAMKKLFSSLSPQRAMLSTAREGGALKEVSDVHPIAYEICRGVLDALKGRDFYI